VRAAPRLCVAGIKSTALTPTPSDPTAAAAPNFFKDGIVASRQGAGAAFLPPGGTRLMGAVTIGDHQAHKLPKSPREGSIKTKRDRATRLAQRIKLLCKVERLGAGETLD
jgi:hypothetical protein